MGERKKPKKYQKMGYHEKEQYRTDQMANYGLDRIKSQQNEITGRGGWDAEAENAAIARAMNNDYDIRESIKYGKETGDKRFADLGSGISNITEANAAHRALAKYGKNELGQTNTSSANDYGNISSSLFKASREQLTDSMTANEQQKEAESGAVAPVSDRLQQDRDTVEELDNKDYDIFNNNIDNGDNQNQRDQASQAFLGKYKLDLKKEKNIQPVLPS